MNLHLLLIIIKLISAEMYVSSRMCVIISITCSCFRKVDNAEIKT